MSDNSLGQDLDQEPQKPQEPSLGQKVKDAESIAQAVAEGGADLAADLRAAKVAIREAPQAAKTVSKGLLIGCLAQVLIFGFAILFFINIFNPDSAEGTTDNASVNPTVSNWTGSTEVVGELGGAKMPALAGKIGHEQHASKQSCFVTGNTHYDGPLSFFATVGSVANCMAFGGPMTTEQEEWYFNMRWYTGSGYPGNVKHKKVIISNPANGKSVVASVEEYGPAARLMARDGINAGAAPEVYNYLELASPYTRDPNDGKGYATFGFAKDQNIPLGPLN